jgi:hypothetical protein
MDHIKLWQHITAATGSNTSSKYSCYVSQSVLNMLQVDLVLVGDVSSARAAAAARPPGHFICPLFYLYRVKQKAKSKGNGGKLLFWLNEEIPDMEAQAMVSTWLGFYLVSFCYLYFYCIFCLSLRLYFVHQVPMP